MIIRLFVLLISLSIGNAQACTVPPPESRELPVEALYRADAAGIVVFDRYEVRKSEIVFYGRVRQVFWGSRRSLEDIRFPWPQGVAFTQTLAKADHDSSRFWTGKSSNLVYASDCRLAPRVKLNVHYLLLRTEPLSRYALEPIDRLADDTWLDLVERTALRKRHASKPN